MRPVRILVTGANGQLAHAIIDAFADRELVAHTRASLDVTDPDAVARVIAAAAPEAIVNCAAFNDVDGAEDAPADAFAVNTLAVRSLARAASACGAALVHYSTDFVFGGPTPDGPAAAPYTEEDRTSPRGAYATSKLAGEWFALEAPGAFVLRVESLFGLGAGWTGRRGTLDRIADAIEAGREAPVFTDRVVSPSHVGDIAAATRHLLDGGHRCAYPGGLYHCVNSGAATWHEVALEVSRALDVRPQLKLVKAAETVFRAPRPLFCALDNRKLTATGFAMPPWQDAIRRWLATRSLPAA